MIGYLVVIEGDYFGSATVDRRREKFPYRITVKVPSPIGALALIKGKLLDKVLRRNYPNYHSWRTHQLVSITNLDGSKVQGLTDPRLMDFNDLADYVRTHKLPLKLELYTDLGYFRTMVHLAETNRAKFLRKQSTLQTDCAEDKALAELNPEIYGASQGIQAFKDSPLPAKPVFYDAAQRIDKVTTSPDEVPKTSSELEYYGDKFDKTTIIQGKPEVAKEAPQGDLFLTKTVDAPASPLLTENKLKPQNVEKVFVKGKGFVNADEFKEDFNREDEKEFEVYEPHKTISVEDL